MRQVCASSSLGSQHPRGENRHMPFLRWGPRYRKDALGGYKDFCGTQMVKNLPAMWETQVWSLGWQDPLEKGIASHSSILSWRIPWTEKPGKLEYTGSQRLRHDWATNTFTCFSLSRSSHPFGPQVASNFCFQLHFQSGGSMKFVVLRLLLPGVTFLRGCLWPLHRPGGSVLGRGLGSDGRIRSTLVLQSIHSILHV